MALGEGEWTLSENFQMDSWQLKYDFDGYHVKIDITNDLMESCDLTHLFNRLQPELLRVHGMRANGPVEITIPATAESDPRLVD